MIDAMHNLHESAVRFDIFVLLFVNIESERSTENVRDGKDAAGVECVDMVASVQHVGGIHHGERSPICKCGMLAIYIGVVLIFPQHELDRLQAHTHKHHWES